ncbi:MAG TPA: ferredoxin III, nif-specific [Pseudomonas sp.]|jgi:Nif-specific ferredoxin III|uniref:ferredoxin III, nif-specific n=1 Tax=Pseudomonas sp. TaxID=306 RepID=UPI002EDACFB0
MAQAMLTGLTRGGGEWTPQFVTTVDAGKCIGCGRCYKVCPRNVFELIERSSVLEADDDYDEDDEMQVMSVADGMDCIGCMSCARVCPKQCHTHHALAL